MTKSVTKLLGVWLTWTLLLTCSLIFGQICQWISLIMTSKVPASLFWIPCSKIKPPWKGNQSIPLDYCLQHAIHAAFDLVIIWVRLVREEIGPLTAKWSANGPLFQLGGLLTTRTLFLFCCLLWSLWNHQDSLNMFFGTTNNKQFLSGYCKLSKKKIKNAPNSNRDASLGSCIFLLLPNLKYFSWDLILHTICSLSGCSWNIDKCDQIQQLITADHSTSSNTWGRKRGGWSLIEQMMGLSFEEGVRRTPARRGSLISHGLSKVRGGWMGWRWVWGLRKRGGNQPWYPPSLHPMYGQYHKTIQPSINRWPFCEASSVELH